MSDFLLTPENLLGYLLRCALIREEREVVIREMGGGVSNIVLLIEWRAGPERRWVAKQSLRKLRVQDDWRSERERVFREAEAIQLLGPLLGDAALPRVISIEPENYFFIMTAAPAQSVVWKDSLLRGCVEPGVARECGRYLGRLIVASRGDLHLRERFHDRTVFDQLRIDPYYRTAAERHPDVRSALEALLADSWKIRTSLVHGDYSPKNMLVREGKIFLIDFEVVHWGDPAFDSAFLLNHLMLKSFHQPRFAPLYLTAAREFWQTLLVGLGTESTEDFEAMTVRHLGGLMLARIDGKSPVEYISDEAVKERVRQSAKRLLCKPPRKLEDALGGLTIDQG